MSHLDQDENGHAILSGLAQEAGRLAALLRSMQDDLASLSSPLATDGLLRSGQALDCAEQGLSDFALFFAALSRTHGAIDGKTMRIALLSTRQDRMRNPQTNQPPNGAGPDSEIELF